MSNQRAKSIETEVKFSVPNKKIFDVLKSLTLLNGFKFESIGTKINADRYLDTPDRRLLQAGYACRVRNQKDKLVSNPQIAHSGPRRAIHKRQEIESEVLGESPEPVASKRSKIFEWKKSQRAKPLELLFEIYQVRHKYLVIHNDATL